MPAYEYCCPACGTSVARIVKIDERDRQVCTCGNFLSRQMSACLPPIFRGVQGSASMGVGKLADVTLTTDPKK